MSDDRASRIRRMRNRHRGGSEPREGAAGDGDATATRDSTAESETAGSERSNEPPSDPPNEPPANASGGSSPGAPEGAERAESTGNRHVGSTEPNGSAGAIDSLADGLDLGDVPDLGDASERSETAPVGASFAVERSTDEAGDDEGVFAEGDTLIPSAHHDDETIQVLEFFLGEDRYAVEIERISAIVEMKEITRFPRGPSAIDGVTDLRGEITAVLDPTALLSVERCEPSSDHYIVVLKRSEDKQKLGIRVTDVSQAVIYHEDRIDETSDVVRDDADHDREYVRGVIKKTDGDRDELVAWLDTDEIVSAIG